MLLSVGELCSFGHNAADIERLTIAGSELTGSDIEGHGARLIGLHGKWQLLLVDHLLGLRI